MGPQKSFFFLTVLETNSVCTVKLFFSFIQLLYSVLLLLLSSAMVKIYIEQQWSNVKRGTSLTMAVSQYTPHPLPLRPTSLPLFCAFMFRDRLSQSLMG